MTDQNPAAKKALLPGMIAAIDWNIEATVEAAIDKLKHDEHMRANAFDKANAEMLRTLRAPPILPIWRVVKKHGERHDLQRFLRISKDARKPRLLHIGRDVMSSTADPVLNALLGKLHIVQSNKEHDDVVPSGDATSQFGQFVPVSVSRLSGGVWGYEILLSRERAAGYRQCLVWSLLSMADRAEALGLEPLPGLLHGNFDGLFVDNGPGKGKQVRISASN